MGDQEQDSGAHTFHREGGDIIFDSPVDKEEAARQRREQEQHEFARSQVKTNRIIAWFTGMLFLATACTIGVGIWQGVISTRSANAARDAAYASQQSAYAACLGAQISRAALVEVQKGSNETHAATEASVYQALAATQSESASMEINFLDPIIKVGEDIRAPYTTINAGSTPAENEELITCAEFLPRFTDPSFKYSKQHCGSVRESHIPGDYGKFGGPILAIAVHDANGDGVKATAQDVADYAAGKKDLTVYARFTFDDIFGVHHQRNLCHALQRFEIGSLIKDNGQKACDKYNKTDKNTVLQKPISTIEPVVLPPSFPCVAPKPN